jgi:hypothetical protein
MLEVGPELPHPCEGVADRLGQLGLAGDLRHLGVQPALQVIEDRLGVRLPEPHPLVRRSTAPLLLDGIEPGNALNGLLGDDRALGLENIDELAANVGQAGHLADAA